MYAPNNYPNNKMKMTNVNTTVNKKMLYDTEPPSPVRTVSTHSGSATDRDSVEEFDLG